MAKTKVLALCPPDHYVLRNLRPIEDDLELHAGAELKDFLPFAAEAEVVLYSGVTGKIASVQELWEHFQHVRWIHSLSAGLDKLLFPELIDSDIVVTNARGVYKRSLAEFAVLGMLYHYKQVRRLVDSQRAHAWQDFMVDWMPDKVMGVVGYGEIGRECALLAKALGVKIYATRRNPARSESDPLIDRVFPLSELNTMLEQVDVVVAAAPLTPETRHMISDAQFAAMKPSAIVINVGRGPVIDERALERALQEGKIRGAALDVFEVEPLSAESPLWDMDNVLISPHCTDRTKDPDWLDLSAQVFVENFRRFQTGQPMENIVDKRAGY